MFVNEMIWQLIYFSLWHPRDNLMWDDMIKEAGEVGSVPTDLSNAFRDSYYQFRTQEEF